MKVPVSGEDLEILETFEPREGIVDRGSASATAVRR